MELESLREHYAALPKEPLVVRLDLQTPVVLGPDPLCLDSLLAYRLAVRLFGRGAFDRMGAMLDLPLPLERTGSVWHASIGFPDSAAHVDHDHLSKRWSVGPPAGVKLGTGWSRMYHLAVFPVSTPSLRFYAIRKRAGGEGPAGRPVGGRQAPEQGLWASARRASPARR